MNTDRLSSEERFNRETWYVLDRIKDQLLTNPKVNIVQYIIPLNKHLEVGANEQFRIFEVLEQKCIIKEIAGASGKIEPDNYAFGKKGDLNYAEGLSFHFEINYKFDKYYKKYKSLIYPEYKTLFGFEDYIFWLNRLNNRPAQIDFHPKEKEGSDSYFLMKALVSHLLANGVRNGNRIKTTVPSSYIQNYMTENYPKLTQKDFSKWISSTKSNLKRKIPKAHQDLILVGDFNFELKGYPFTLVTSS